MESFEKDHIRDVRFAHEKTRIFGAHLPCHPVVILYGISFLPDPNPHTRFFVSPSLFISCFCSSDQEPGREALERGTALPLSKDGSMILDEGRLLTLFRS